jgi:glycerate-2-kinase
MSEADLTTLYELLLGAGLDIHAMNAVRKRFSRWSAGRLALALAPAATRCFAVSDVKGDDLSVIGSGPCVPDAVTAREIIGILERARLLQRIPKAHRAYLDDVARSRIPETPRATHPAFAHVEARVVGNLQLALDGAAARARAHLSHVEVVDNSLSGDAATAGEAIARYLLTQRRDAGDEPLCYIWGGETTVDVGTANSVSSGSGGGRCQELALAASHVLSDAGDAAAGISILAAGTDGRDGNTDAAGAIVDNSTWNTIASAGGDPATALATHQSFSALRAASAIIPRRDTGTNVTDIVIGLAN